MGLTKFFNKNSNLINLLIISPVLFLVDFSYQKFAILALVLGFLILIQNLFLIIYKLTSDPKKKKHWFGILTNVLNIILIVPLCLYQYVNPSFNIYNKFVAVFLAIYSSIKLIFKRKYEKNTSCVVNNIKNYNKNPKNNQSCSKETKTFEFTSCKSGNSPKTNTCESSTNYSYSTEISTKEATLICRKFNIKSD
jgi:amino acid transporter